MYVKENKKQNKKKISELNSGALFKCGDSYFIRTSAEVYRHRGTVTGVSLCCDSCPEYEFNEYYEPINAICVSDGRPCCFRYSESVEVFPDAFISLGE